MQRVPRAIAEMTARDREVTCRPRDRSVNAIPAIAFPYIISKVQPSGLGVSTQVLWLAGEPVTFVQFFRPAALYLDMGTVTGNIDTPPALSINGQGARGSSLSWHGFEFDAVPVDVVGEIKVQTA